MARLIDADELMKNIRCFRNGDCEHCEYWEDGDSHCDGELYGVDVMRAPTVKVEPIHEPTKSEYRRMAAQDKALDKRMVDRIKTWIEIEQCRLRESMDACENSVEGKKKLQHIRFTYSTLCRLMSKIHDMEIGL